MPKMPTLGPSPKKSGPGTVALLLVCFAAAAFGYAYWTKQRGAGSRVTFMKNAIIQTDPTAGVPLPSGAVALPSSAAAGPTVGAPRDIPPPPPLAGLAPVAVPPPPPTGPRHFSVTVDGPLETAIISAAGRSVGPALAQVVTRALVWWMTIPGDLRKGDRLDLIYEERGSEEPQVDAVRLVSGKLNKTFQAYRYKPEGEPYERFFQPNGQELEMRLRASPLETYEQITSLIRDGRHHKGVDFKTPVGSKVRATFAATVTRKNWHWKANGNCLELTEAGAPFRKALYLHLSELPKSLAVGHPFARGEVIADSGNTGHSFAPHLHYQLMAGNSERVLDPFEAQESFRRSLPASQKPALDAKIGKWEALLTRT